MKKALAFFLCFILISFYIVIFVACIEDKQKKSESSTFSDNSTIVSEYSRPSYSNGTEFWEEENPDKWYWEDDANIPDFDFSIPEVPYEPGDNNEYGENGADWELPKWGEMSLPFTTDDLYIPDDIETP